MTKGSVWVYDRDTMSMVPKEQLRERSSHGGVTFLADLPDFVSPIDGKLYSGRAGLREHNAKHDVVSNADLKGLPVLQANSDQRTAEQRRASNMHRKQTIINEVNKHYR